MCTKVVVGTSLQCTHGGWGSATSSQCVHHKADTALVCRKFSGKSHVSYCSAPTEVSATRNACVGSGWGGGSLCRVSIIRNGNVALSEFKKRVCHPVEFKKGLCRPVEFKKRLCRMLLRPKNGCVALLILGVYTHLHQVSSPTRAPNESRFESRFEAYCSKTSSSSTSLQCTHGGWGSATSSKCVHHKADTALVCRKFSGKSYTSHTVVRPVVVAPVCSAPMEGGVVPPAVSVCTIRQTQHSSVGSSPVSLAPLIL